jgi:predicted nucleic acid-binding protein
VVLDSEGLWAVARNDSSDVRAVLAASRNAGVAVLVPAVVLAETLFGDERDARANQVLKRLVVVEITEPVARLAAKLKNLAEMPGVAATVDAIVVATSALAGGGVIITSDANGIGKLANVAVTVRIRPVRV